MLRKTTSAHRAPIAGRLGRRLLFRARLSSGICTAMDTPIPATGCILKKFEVMEEDSIDEWENEAEDSKKKKGGRDKEAK